MKEMLKKLFSWVKSLASDKEETNQENISKKNDLSVSNGSQEIKNWLGQAQNDLRTAEHSLESEDYYASVFWCQQAAEKALKAVYMKLNKNILKVHDLVKLAREIKAPQEIIVKCAKINPVYIEVKYPDSGELPSDKVNKAEAKELLALAGEILKWVEEKI